jgi:hypothetical protein
MQSAYAECWKGAEKSPGLPLLPHHRTGRGIALTSPDGSIKKVLTLNDLGEPVWTVTE